MPALLPRSYLFVPGDKPALFAKALATDADQVILDLEDAVGPGAKDAARDAIRQWLPTGQPVAVRVNATESGEHDADLSVCALPNVAAVVIPKVVSADALRRTAARLPSHVALLPMVETARGLAEAEVVARMPGVSRFLFGAIDFQADLGVPDDDEGLRAFRSQLVYVSRLGGIGAPADGVTRRYDDLEPVRAEADRARRLGFGGKLCIHPKQVAVVNAVFSPTDADIAWAERVIVADRAAGGGVTSVDNEMIDRPVKLRAEAILARAGR